LENAPKISLIVALTAGGVIGAENRIPWRIREDLQLFKRITLGHPVIMGRKTFQSLPGGTVLKGRLNLVVSRSWTTLPEAPEPGTPEAPEGPILCSGLEEAFEAAARPREGFDSREIFIIGGAQIYRQALPLADRLYLSRVRKEYPGDTLFPRFDEARWPVTETEEYDEFFLEIRDRKEPD